MQINLQESGTFLFTSDHFHVIENVSSQRSSQSSCPLTLSQWRDGVPQGWLARNHVAWFNSTQRVKRLVQTTKCRVVPGHDEESFLALQKEGGVFS